MPEKTKPEEMIALAEALGAMISGAAQDLAAKGLLPREQIKAAIGAGIQRVRTGRLFTSSQEHRDAIADALQRTAVI